MRTEEPDFVPCAKHGDDYMDCDEGRWFCFWCQEYEAEVQPHESAVAALRTRLAAAEGRVKLLTEALRDAEWGGDTLLEESCCPVCRGLSPDSEDYDEQGTGHRHGCVVHAALAGAAKGEG